MERATSLDEQVRTNLANIAAAPQFAGNRVWLTFYLCGPPEKLQIVSRGLADRGCLNTDGWEGGFLYPKLEADLTAAAILEVALAVQALCGLSQVEILNIDVDTSPDVKRSQFMTLYRS